jgi:TatD DNase family protein
MKDTPVPAPSVEYVDTHCHIGGPEFDADRDDVVGRARAAGVKTMLVVGGLDGRGGHERALRSAERYGFPVAVGIHPHEARFADEEAYEELGRLASSARIVAIGEIGLDFHYDLSPREEQCAAFQRQIRLAGEAGLPIIIHTREAEAETMAILEEAGVPSRGGVLHCFSGSKVLARRALDLGLYISFSGIVAFPKADGIREIARFVPDDRILVETDAPYLAPPPHRGRRNEPAYVVDVARAVAEARGRAASQMAGTVIGNFGRFVSFAKR